MDTLKYFSDYALNQGWCVDGESTQNGFLFYNAQTNERWIGWQAAKSQAIPEGFVLVLRGVLDLTRFMCETWNEIDKFVYKNCQNLELYPLIQESKTQSAIRKIGKQKFNPFTVGAGIQAMIEAQELNRE